MAPAMTVQILQKQGRRSDLRRKVHRSSIEPVVSLFMDLPTFPIARLHQSI
jgi:hypothetical protein